MGIVFDYQDKNVLVVGGTSGINLGIAESFARQRANVAVVSRSQDKVDRAVERLESEGASKRAGFSADVRDADAVAEGIQKIHVDWGDFDVVVSGAAGNFPALANKMSSNGFRSVIEIDLLGTFHVMKAIYPCIKKPGSSIINISAPQSFLAIPGQSHVCAAKAGVDMITRTLALEWGHEGVRVNSIVPGPIEGTEGMARLAPTDKHIAMTIDSVPLRRLGTTDDIAYCCQFLGSEYATYINGIVIPVDGGWSLGGAHAMSKSLSQML